MPDYLPDTADVRQDLADFYGSIAVADAAVGQLLDTLSRTGLDRTTWVVFMTDHGPALPRAKSTLYDAGTGIAHDRATADAEEPRAQVYDELFSGVDLVPTLLDLLGVPIPEEVEGISHARQSARREPSDHPVRTEVYTTKTYHDSFDPIRAVRTKEYSYIENYATRPLLDLPLDIAESAPGQAVAPLTRGPRPAASSTTSTSIPPKGTTCWAATPTDKAEAIADEMAMLLERLAGEDQRRHPVRIRRNQNRRALHRDLPAHPRLELPSRSAIAADRGVDDDDLQQ